MKNRSNTFGIIAFVAVIVSTFTFTTCATSGALAGIVSLDQAIQKASQDIENNVQIGMKIAVLNFSSTSEQFSAYVLEELSDYLVKGKKLVVVDRKELDLIRQEEQFQMSGEVSDESAQAIGKKLGAQLIVSGSLTPMGNTYRFRIRVLNVESAAIEAASSSDIDTKERKVALLFANTQTVKEEPKEEPSPSYYVNTNGNDLYEGTSEGRPFKTLNHAIMRAAESDIKIITVIGTLDSRSEGTKNDAEDIFFTSYSFSSAEPPEILITGKKDAASNEKAVLSGREITDKNVFRIYSGIFRFENIEISGGQGKDAIGIILWPPRYTLNYVPGLNEKYHVPPKVTLGSGTVIRNNEGGGILVGYNSNCVIDGGDIHDNKATGVRVALGNLSIQKGTINDNGFVGVYIEREGNVSMTGGTITNNGAHGVLVDTGCTFNQTGGTIRGNKTLGFLPEIVRQKDTKGTNL